MLQFLRLSIAMCFIVSSTNDLIGQVQSVTLRLDMHGQQIAPSGPSVAGNFQSSIGGSNWTPGQHFLTDPDQDSIYEITFSLSPGLYAYKFINGSSWSDPNELVGPDCGKDDGAGNFNRELIVGKNGADLLPHSFDECEGLVRFQVDMSQQTVSPNGVHLSGDDWLWWGGYGSAWETDVLPMFDLDNDQIYETSIFIQDTNMIRYRFFNGDQFVDGEPIPGPCSSPTALVTRWFQGSINPQTLPLVCYGECGPCEFLADTNYATYWWNESVFYEIFVRSFYDSDGDGIGDFQGIIQKLDYLNDGDSSTTDDLGIDAIWLMPIMPSPSYHGYDVTDYEAINPDFGSMSDFDAFLDSAHSRGVKVILDFVMNHSSSQHPWFTSSASNPSGPFSDYYIWSPVDSGYQGPWGQQVWHANGNRYFYGLFWGGMPDLNYDNPSMKLAMLDAAEFWLNRGVDGFRLDAIKYLDEDFPVMENTPETFQILQEYKQHVRSVNSEAISVGEVWSSTPNVVPYVDTTLLDICFEFDLASTLLLSVNTGNESFFNSNFGSIVNAYPKLQLAPFLSNHDQDRVMSVFNEDLDKMKLAAGLLLTMPGTPFIYYGEEVGMTGTGAHENIRRPMQWSTANWAGFTSGQPWIGVNGNFGQYNVAVMQADSLSLLESYKKLIHLRQSNEILQLGYPLLVNVVEPSTISFARILKEEGLLVVANLGSSSVQPTLSLIASSIRSDNYSAIDILSGNNVGTVQIGSQGEISQSSFNQSLAAQSIWILDLVPSSSIGKEENLSSSFEMKVYPNPAQDIIIVESSKAHSKLNWQIVNVNGQEVLRGEEDKGFARLDVSSLPKGMYLLIARTDSNEVSVKRWVKK